MKMKVIWLLTVIVFFISVTDGFSQDNFAQTSVLNTGTWYKVKIEKSGIYKLSYEDIQSMGFSTPENIRIYGNGGKQLPFNNSALIADDLLEVPLYVKMGSDNTFGPGDFILFYGEGVSTWSYNRVKDIYVQSINEYSIYSYYFLTTGFGPGQRIEAENFSGLTPNQTITEYNWRDFHEVELRNLIESGRRWYGERFDENQFKWDVTIDDLIKENPIVLTTSMAVRSANNSSVSVKANDISIDTLNFRKVYLNDQESSYADTNFSLSTFLSSSNSIEVQIGLINNNMATDVAYVDYVTINARCRLTISGAPFYFRDPTSVGSGNIAKYIVAGADENTQIWNISQHNHVYWLSGTLNGNNYEFIAPNDTLQEYVAVDLSFNYSRPILSDDNMSDVGLIENQNLHGLVTPEYLIVTHPYFVAESDSLAEFRRKHDSMNVMVITADKIYNEFSSGKPDISAIRNFARMLWYRSNQNDSLKYLLLFGDGSFDNHTPPVKNPNYIPTYQSTASISPVNTYTTDDYFGMLEPGEWKTMGTLDIGVGRIPVSYVENAPISAGMLVVKKIKSYYAEGLMKDWRNQLIFLADDGEHEGYGGFMTDTDQLTEVLENKSPALTLKKIYLDAYEQTSSSTGASYPDVEEEIINGINKGALIFNYMGHGGPNAITQELVLQVADVENLQNAPFFPLFITATCQMGRFDYVKPEGGNYIVQKTLGESALLNPNGGAIALLTTTRLVYQSDNLDLSYNLYNMLLKKDYNGKPYKLGDVLRIAKNNTESGFSNKFKFVLLGDPALGIALPEFIVLTDSINEYSADVTDTLNALGKVAVSGYVAFSDSTIISDFNGVVQLKVFDKKYMVTTRGNDGIPTFDFSVQDRLLYRGKASVVNGRFKAEFKIPKDITYSLGTGKISYYAQNGLIDANGAYDNFIIGGTSDSYEPDNEGPVVTMYINDENFKDGGITGPNPILLVNIFDENGINTTGNGIGHDIVGVLDRDIDDSKKYMLNDYFEGDLDNYQSGSLRYPFSQLEEGPHTVNLKVWDIYNNSADAEIGFYVKLGTDMVIDKLFNYPNPMKDVTNFQYTHNLPGIHDITIDVFDLSGRLVYTYQTSQNVEGFVSEPIIWQVNSSKGRALPPGVYPYRISVNVTSFDGLKTYKGIQNSKIIIIP